MDYRCHKNFCWGIFFLMIGVNSFLNLLAGSHPCQIGLAQKYSIVYCTNRDLPEGEREIGTISTLGRAILLHSTKILRASRTPLDTLLPWDNCKPYTIPTPPKKNSALASSKELPHSTHYLKK